jgi:hypothetical protein
VTLYNGIEIPDISRFSHTLRGILQLINKGYSMC